ncbi:unnamed protein product [Auanema sp. JU1783]|nr:unnamed protein product [Auanema sp. JU1783]
MTRVYLVRPGPATERIGPVRRSITRAVPSTPTSRVPQPSRKDVLDDIEDILNDGPENSGPRRRERLNHLTQEEKMNRRKLKNRVAAQTARDRKKARSQKLEDVVRDLMAENKRLREENSRLTEENKKCSPAVGQGQASTFSNSPFIDDLIPEEELAKIIEDLKTDFIPPLYSEGAPVCGTNHEEGHSSPSSSSYQASQDFGSTSVTSEDFMNVDDVPHSPTSSSTSYSTHSPVHFDNTSSWSMDGCLDNDPLLSDYPPEQLSFGQGSLYPSDNLSPYSESFTEEFFELY